MSNPSRRAALHVVPTWSLLLIAGLGLALVIIAGGDPASASEFLVASVDAGGWPLAAAGVTLATLTGLALLVAVAALAVVIVLELRRRRTHGQG